MGHQENTLNYSYHKNIFPDGGQFYSCHFTDKGTLPVSTKTPFLFHYNSQQAFGRYALQEAIFLTLKSQTRRVGNNLMTLALFLHKFQVAN